MKQRKMERIGTETEFRGLCRNKMTGEYEVLFHTFISDVLCRNRTIEKAKLNNEMDCKRFQYDLEDILIQYRDVTTYASGWKTKDVPM